ncbi:MAG: rhodanese-like domain-containing protein [Pseudomonadota bacterium]|nr:rhodanese-like domain-containing protein [Pseudomonadota bacterium]
MESSQQLLETAAARGRELEVPYAGALLPAEAWALVQGLPETVLVDVRTQAELDWVGFVPGACHVEWQRYPGGVANPDFLAQLQAQVRPHQAVLFLCRSGGRSHAAAALAAQVGYARAYNVLQGFEGDRDQEGRRNRVGGWRAAGLPWKQG